MNALLWNKASRPGPVLLLAHGAGAPMDSDFMVQAATGLAQRGIHVARFEFPYMAQRRIDQRKRPPDRAAKLLECFAGAVAAAGGAQHVFIGGKSMGGRMATLLATQLAVRGVVVLGYPFHPLGKPERLRIDHFNAMQAPCLICQGERDAMGTREDVAGYHLQENPELFWLPDGNHDWKPRVRSGVSWQQNREQALNRVSQWVLQEA